MNITKIKTVITSKYRYIYVYAIVFIPLFLVAFHSTNDLGLSLAGVAKANLVITYILVPVLLNKFKLDPEPIGNKDLDEMHLGEEVKFRLVALYIFLGLIFLALIILVPMAFIIYFELNEIVGWD